MSVFQPLVSATNKLIGRYTSGTGLVEQVSLGNNLAYTNSTLNAASYLKEHVDAATTAALTVTSSGSGVGQTLTNAGAQAAIVIDGVTLAVNDRVLVKDQATGAENGIYTVTDIGSVATNWVLTRSTDADGSDAGLVESGMQVTALNGTANARIIYILTTANPITIGSTALTFQGNNAGGLSGSGSANRVAYFDSSGVLTTTSFLDVDSTDKTLRHYQSASTGNTVINGLALTNDTAATSGNQMYSGAIYWKGSGWRTGGGGSSTTCEFRSYILPVQSSGSSECTLTFEANQAGAGWVNVLQLRNNTSAPQLLAEFASTALPSYSYRVDPDTGLRRSGTNAQALICGGSEIAGVDVNGFCVGTLGINNANFGVHPTTTTKHGAVWRSRNSISVDYFNFQNDSATQEASLFRSSGTSGDWKWRMTGGTAALPSYSFFSDTDSGMYSQAANALGFSVAGAECFRMTANTMRLVYDASNYVEISVSSSGLVNLNATGSSAAFYFNDHIYMLDAKDFSFGGTTGTKFGQATTEKIAFWNQTPIVQPTTAVAAATLTGGGGTNLTDTDIFDGYTLQQVVKALRNIGLLA